MYSVYYHRERVCDSIASWSPVALYAQGSAMSVASLTLASSRISWERPVLARDPPDTHCAFPEAGLMFTIHC